MSFVHPTFLWALLLLLIPIIIHLFNFRRFRTIYFTNVRFLKNIQEETATKNKLKHLLVLMSRLLAVAFLVFAFAQPFIPADDNTAKPTTRAVSIYLDNSFSMETVNNDQRLFDIAKRKAEEIAEAYRVDDEFQLLTNDFEAGHQRLVNKEAFLQMLAQVQISPAVKTTDEIIKRQKDILNRASEEQRSIFLISDFQKNITQLKADSTVQINLVPVKSNEVRNLSIDSAWFISPVQMVNQASVLCVRVHNYGTEDINNSTLNLKINGQIKGISDMQIPAGAEIIDTLNFTINESIWQQGELFVQDYPVTFDDIFYFTYKPVTQIPVLCINGNKSNPYLNSLFSASPVFSFSEQQINQLNVSQLDKFNLIILNELNNISSGVREMLTKAVTAGASVMVIPSMEMDITSVNDFLRECNAGEYDQQILSKRNVARINNAHSIFSDVFEKIPQNITLPFANQSYTIRSGGRQMSQNIMLFSDDAPFLAGYSFANGTVYVFATSFQNTTTDFPVQGGIFVPVLFRIAILSQPLTPLYVTIGSDTWIKIQSDMEATAETVTLTGAGGEFIPTIRRSGNKVEMNAVTYTKSAGLFTIDETADKQQVALNYDRRESELQFYSAGELADQYSTQGFKVISNTSQSIAGAVLQLNEGRVLWKICIILALAFLAIEVLLIRFMP